MFTFSKKIQESVHHLHGPPKKRTVRLEKKHMWNPDLAFFRWGVYLWANVKLIQALHHLRQHLGELPCQEQKVAGSREKVGFYWIFFRNNYAKCFLLVNFFGFGSWPLFFWSSFFGGFPTKWCLWLHDSIHDHRRSRFWNSCPRPNDVWWSLKKLRQFRLHSAVFSVWGRRICMYLL